MLEAPGEPEEAPEERLQVSSTVEDALLDADEVRRIVQGALEYGGRGEVGLSVALLSEPELCELHERFLGDPSPTDVISFDLGEDEGPVGEICVSVDQALRVAAERGVRPQRELALYLVHGVLHLCGHDDHEDEERARMREAERAVLDRLGYEADDAPHDR